MRLYPLAFAVLSACTFVGAPGDPGLEPGVDAARAPTPEADADDRVPVTSPCDPADRELRLCIDFEEPAPFQNKSPTAHAVQVQNIDLELRGAAGIDGQAAELDAVSRLTIGESPALDVDVVSVSMWIQPHAPNVDQFLLDNHIQYAMIYEADSEIRCQVGSANTQSELAVPVSSSNWTHVACTYDRQQIRVYIDGSLEGCQDHDRAINKTGGEGSSIGGNIELSGVTDPFSGGVDDVRVHARVLTPAEICTAAGKPSCKTTCPD